MKIEPKKIYERMVDFRSYAIVLLSIGVFIYLGMIIPSEYNTTIRQLIEAGGSLSFLTVSILFFIQSKKLRKKLEELE